MTLLPALEVMVESSFELRWLDCSGDKVEELLTLELLETAEDVGETDTEELEAVDSCAEVPEACATGSACALMSCLPGNNP
jgi:hypothetical protein